MQGNHIQATHIITFTTLAKDEELDTILTHHRAGWDNELSGFTEEQNLHNVHFTSLVTKDGADWVVDKEYEDINKVRLMNAIIEEVNKVLESGFSSEIIAGAGSSVKIVEY